MLLLLLSDFLLVVQEIDCSILSFVDCNPCGLPSLANSNVSSRDEQKGYSGNLRTIPPDLANTPEAAKRLV